MSGCKLRVEEFPLVSVLLPAYNSEHTIETAINSILGQTYKNLELIVINDGSSDGTRSKILGICDNRIKFYENEGNKGLIATLNRGINLANGKYIARMDADDISHPTRIERQVQYMESNSDTIVCGTDVKYFGGQRGRFSKPKLKIKSNDIKNSLLIHCSLHHPTVMIRREILIKYNIRYNHNFRNAEDYKFWVDLLDYGEFHNIAEKLLFYRISSTQISTAGHNLQIQNSIKCQNEYFRKKYPECDLPKNINIDSLRRLRNMDTNNRYILPYLYHRLNNYGIRELFYYLFSFDWIRMERRDFIILCYKFLGLR